MKILRTGITGFIGFHLAKKAIKKFMDIQAGDLVETFADISGLINDFDYKPKTSLSVGRSTFVKWYKEFYQ